MTANIGREHLIVDKSEFAGEDPLVERLVFGLEDIAESESVVELEREIVVIEIIGDAEGGADLAAKLIRELQSVGIKALGAEVVGEEDIRIPLASEVPGVRGIGTDKRECDSESIVEPTSADGDIGEEKEPGSIGIIVAVDREHDAGMYAEPLIIERIERSDLQQAPTLRGLGDAGMRGIEAGKREVTGDAAVVELVEGEFEAELTMHIVGGSERIGDMARKLEVEFVVREIGPEVGEVQIGGIAPAGRGILKILDADVESKPVEDIAIVGSGDAVAIVKIGVKI